MSVNNLFEKENINYSREVVFNGLPYRRFDFYLPKYNTAIEFDGKQHFEYSEDFDQGDVGNFLKRVDADTEKDNFCKQARINLVRVKYTKINGLRSFIFAAINKLFKNTS